MSNVFMRRGQHSAFTWDSIGNIKEGRGDLGEDVPVLLYRLMQYTMLDVLSGIFGEYQANVYFRKAGYIAGEQFAKNMLNLETDFDTFIAGLQKTLQEYRVGILRMENFDPKTETIVLTVGQDLDCSGLPITNETVCTYDEGFISGILESYTGKKYKVQEIDCWANGDRLCRFKGTLKEY
ncbi:MAG: 4-vinyl reductase [Clostridiales bacterium]|jgi:predicted hydrocarbon binding protein|nr:4-vinyl reductase [Clostridiales bacterium]